MKLRVATRGSPLALRQTQIVADELAKHFPELEIQTLIIKTEGDIKIESPISEIKGKSIFVAELEKALLDDKADIAIHSAKDLSARLPLGLSIGAVLKRGDPRDVLVGADSVENLPEGSMVATGSQRRKAQLAELRGDLRFCELRGNIETRLSKIGEKVGVENNEIDAILVAKVALDRLNIKPNQDFCIFETDVMLPQVGQGSLAVQYVDGKNIENIKIAKILTAIDDSSSRIVLEAERGFLEALDGDCNIVAASYAQITADKKLKIQGMLELKKAALETTDAETPRELGIRLAQDLLS